VGVILLAGISWIVGKRLIGPIGEMDESHKPVFD
jgi:hypothetical protein